MPWLRDGTVSCTQNSPTVSGTNTRFAANARVGDAFLGPDGRWYEVVNIPSDTTLSILPAYLGPTVNAGVYALAPMQGYVKESADRLRALVDQFGKKLAALGTTGNYDTLPLEKGGTGQSVSSKSDLLSALGAMPIGGGNYAPNFVNTWLFSPPNPGQGQGLHMGWNEPAGSGLSGHASFTVNKGSGSGGFSFRSVNAANNVGGPIMTYTYEGVLNVPTALRLGGIDIVAFGSNTNGNWIRFQDGTQICWKQVAVNSANYAITAGLLGSDAYGAGAFPAEFTQEPVVTASVRSNEANTNLYFASNYQPSSRTSWGNWRTISSNGAGGGYSNGGVLNLMAVGRWR